MNDLYPENESNYIINFLPINFCCYIFFYRKSVGHIPLAYNENLNFVNFL